MSDPETTGEAPLPTPEALTPDVLISGLMSSADVRLAFVDRDLRYRYVSTALAAVNGCSVRDHIGRTVSEVLPALAPILEPVLQQVMDSGQAVRSWPHAGVTAATPGERREWVGTYIPVAGPGGDVIGIGILLDDVTERKRSERLLATEHALHMILTEAGNEIDAMPRILDAIGRGLDWDVGAFWNVQGAEECLRDPIVWRRHPHIGAAFEDVSCAAAFPPGVGLPGRVWRGGEAVWVPDVVVDANFPRRVVALRDGLHGAVAFPVTTMGQILGVVEFLAREVRPPDETTRRAIAALGHSIGEFLHRSRGERALRVSEARKSAILETALDGVITIDHQGRVIEFNDAAIRIFGYARADVLGREMAELIIPASRREAHRKGLARLQTTGEGRLLGRRLEMMALRADGSEFPVELTITRISADGPPLYTGYVRDITERRRAEEERAEMLARERESRAAAERAAERSRFLAEAGALLASSLDYEVTLGAVARLTVPHIADSCIVDLFNEDGTLKRVAVAGWDAEKEALTRTFAERYPPDPEGPHPIMKVRRTGRSELIPEVSDEVLTGAIRTAEHLAQLRALGLRSALVVPLRARDHVLGALTLVSTKPGRRYGAEDVAFAEDLAYRAALAIENALLYREAHAANRMKDEFLATLSHELRTPLTSILGWVRMLRTGSVAGHRVAHGLEVVERNATAQARLIDDLLDVSRAIRGGVQLHIRALRLSSVLAAAVDTVRPSALARSIGLHVEVAPAAEDVAGDPDRLQQVFWNLLSNAVRFTPPGGRVSIVALRAPTGVRVAVSDTGPGIAPELLPHVFERFRQGESRGRLPRGGLGLGLAIVRHLVELHGGTVEATNTATDSGATGATFTVTLPAGETVGAGQP